MKMSAFWVLTHCSVCYINFSPLAQIIILKVVNGWAWWLMPVIPALWEAEEDEWLKARSLRLVWATW